MKRAVEEGSEVNLSVDESAALEAADCSLNAALQKECERFGITIAQCRARRGLAKSSVIQLKQNYIKEHRSEIALRNQLRGKIAKMF